MMMRISVPIPMYTFPPDTTLTISSDSLDRLLPNCLGSGE